MIRDEVGQGITDQAEAYQWVRTGECPCAMCDGMATDLHNHRETYEEWEALCALCHAAVEARECAYTPIGMLAVRYADVVRAKNKLGNRLQARQRLGWDAVEADFHWPMVILSKRREALGKLLDQQARKHPMYAWFDEVYGIGPRAAALLIAVEERAFAQGITSVRNQRKYFGFVPEQDQKYHHTCKWLISQALGSVIQTQKGLFGELYREYRVQFEAMYEKKARIHNATMARVMREFLKALCLRWREYEGLENGTPHPDDNGPRVADWAES